MSVLTQRPVTSRANGSAIAGPRLRTLLLGSGIAFPLLWIGMDVLASSLYDGYAYLDQTVSELSAIDAPTRTFWVWSSVFYNALEIAFAVGVWLVAPGGRALRLVATLFITHALLNLIVGPFSSMHQRAVLADDGATISDTLHLVLVGADAIIFFAQVGFAATVFGARFRLYSAVTALGMLAFGFLTSYYAPDVQADEPTPWLGVYERISAYGYMLWVAIFAVALLRSSNVGPAERERSTMWRP